MELDRERADDFIDLGDTHESLLHVLTLQEFDAEHQLCGFTHFIDFILFKSKSKASSKLIDHLRNIILLDISEFIVREALKLRENLFFDEVNEFLGKDFVED